MLISQYFVNLTNLT